jgi:uncharacterized protein (DUF697 family)
MSDNFVSRTRARLEREVLAIEKRTDLSDDQKASQIVVVFATVCAGLAVQPIPFADFFLLTPLQAYMGTRLAAIRGIEVSEQEVTDIIKQVMGVVGLGLVAQQLGIAAAKILFPIFGGVATIPVVFGLTYAIGQVMDRYFFVRAAGRKLTPDEIRSVWKQAKAAGRKAGEEREAEIKRDEPQD